MPFQNRHQFVGWQTPDLYILAGSQCQIMPVRAYGNVVHPGQGIAKNRSGQVGLPEIHRRQVGISHKCLPYTQTGEIEPLHILGHLEHQVQNITRRVTWQALSL